MTDLPPPLPDLRRRVDTALEQALRPRLDRLVALDDGLEPVARELEATVLEGGKRLRPCLLLLGHRAAGGDDGDAMGAAVALELLHTCALIHDDVIDAAPTRRGRPTVHRLFAGQHRDRGLDGDPDRFGEAVAILVGDLAFVLADELFLTASVPHDRLLDGFSRFTQLREEVMAGQYLDLLLASEGDASHEQVLTVAATKSGRYSVSRPLQLGAALAGADTSLIEGLQAVGEPLGLAFQVRDDILGVFGDQSTTGKSVSSDLVEGKRTLLVVETLERLDREQRDRFLGHLGDPGLDPDAAGWMREAIRDSGGLEATKARVSNWVEESAKAAGSLEVSDDARTILLALGDWVAQRQA